MPKAGHEGKASVEAGELFYNSNGTIAVHPDKIKERLKQGKRIDEIYTLAYEKAIAEGDPVRIAQNKARQEITDFLALWAIPEENVNSYFETSLMLLKLYEEAYYFKVQRGSTDKAAEKFALSTLESNAEDLGINAHQILARFDQAKELKKVYDRTFKHITEEEGLENAHALAMEQVHKRVKMWQIPENDIMSRTLAARAFYADFDWDMLASLPWSILECTTSAKLSPDYRKKLIELEYYSRMPEYEQCDWAITTNLSEFAAYGRASSWQKYNDEVSIKYLLMLEYLNRDLSEEDITALQQYRHNLALQEELAALSTDVEEETETVEEPVITMPSLNGHTEQMPVSSSVQEITEQTANDLVTLIEQTLAQFQLTDAISAALAAKDETISALQALVEELQRDKQKNAALLEGVKTEYQNIVDEYNELFEEQARKELEHQALLKEYESYKQTVQQHIVAVENEIKLLSAL